MHNNLIVLIIIVIILIIFVEATRCYGCCNYFCWCGALSYGNQQYCCCDSKVGEGMKKGREGLLYRPRVITLHYTNWCPACKATKPVWESVKLYVQSLQNKPQEGNSQMPFVQFVQVDEDVAHTPGISSYPTIMMNDNGVAYKFDGVRDYNTLLTWVLTPNPPQWP
jgi:thioredoxin family protein